MGFISKDASVIAVVAGFWLKIPCPEVLIEAVFIVLLYRLFHFNEEDPKSTLPVALGIIDVVILPLTAISFVDTLPMFTAPFKDVVPVTPRVDEPVKAPVAVKALFIVVVPDVAPMDSVVPAFPIFSVVTVSLKRFPVVAVVFKDPLVT